MKKFIRIVNKIVELEIAMIIEIFMMPVYTVAILIKGSSRSAGRFTGRYARAAVVLQSIIDWFGCIS
jgi:hypothetical protein